MIPLLEFVMIMLNFVIWVNNEIIIKKEMKIINWWKIAFENFFLQFLKIMTYSAQFLIYQTKK